MLRLGQSCKGGDIQGSLKGLVVYHALRGLLQPHQQDAGNDLLWIR